MLKYILTIILSVGRIVTDGRTKSTVTSTGVEASTQPTSALFVDRIVPYPIPDELASSIVAYI